MDSSFGMFGSSIVGEENRRRVEEDAADLVKP